MEDIAKAMLAQIRREYAEYADVVDVEAQMSTVRLIASAFLATTAQQRPLSEEERDRFAAVGAEAARYGFSRRSLLAGAQLGIRMAWLFAAEEAREMRPAELAISALQEMGLFLFTFAANLSAALEEGHRAQTDQMGRKTPSGPQDVLTDLLLGSPEPLDQLLERAANRGLDPTLSYGVVLVFGQNGDTERARISDAANQATRAITSGIPVAALHGATPHVAIVSPSPSRRAWQIMVARVSATLKPLPIAMLALGPMSGLEKVIDDYRWARHVLRVARSATSVSNVVWDRDLAVYRVLQDSGEVERQKYVALILGPVLGLPPQRRDVLLATAEAVEVQGQRMHAAALGLHVHEKTLRYRLDRIEELTGLDLQSPRDRFRLQLALHLLKLGGYPSG